MSSKYISVDSETNCAAHSDGTDFEFNTWTENPLTNTNSTTPLEASDHPEIERGIFTANFKPPHQLTTEELTSYTTIITGVISAAVAINGALLVVPRWRRARKQRTHLKECIQLIDDDVVSQRMHTKMQ
jgi:hypothetical protein